LESYYILVGLIITRVSIIAGQTVEVLKSYVESEYGIPMSQQYLFLENLLMMDPLSLLDFSEAKGTESII
jgi:hypothetical protein